MIKYSNVIHLVLWTQSVLTFSTECLKKKLALGLQLTKAQQPLLPSYFDKNQYK